MRTVAAAILCCLAAAPAAQAHGEGEHVGFVSTVSTIEPPQPGLLVQVLGGHQRVSVTNFSPRQIVILDAEGEPIVEIPRGETEVWNEPRIGADEDPPEEEGLVRNWRIEGTADGEPFAIVGFLGYRPPPGAPPGEGGLPAWAIVLAALAGLVAAGAAAALPLARRRGKEDAETAP